MATTTLTRTRSLAMSRSARQAMLDAFARQCGCAPLSPRTIRLPGGNGVPVDGATVDENVIVEIEEHFDPNHEGLRARAGQALLTLSLARSARPSARTALVVGSEQVRAVILQTLPSYLTDCVEVEVVRFPQP